METTKLKKFAQEARQLLMAQVSARMDHVLAAESPARREAPKAVQELEQEIAKADRAQVVEKVAYTWFNRFTALRFMDVNGYTSTGIVSPAEARTRPEILADAAAGVIDEDTPNATKQAVLELLEGRVPSQDPQGEAYRLLLVATCNQWHGAMPFLFEKIADYTELLMPADLLSTDSILARMRAVMTKDACKDVEIIGWLYQFYISEKKDEVFAGLKKNVKITPENIPAATQLFTPHWIVRYLVENSLGRLWMLNNPGSSLVGQMDYYIAPEEPEEDFLRIASPEEIKICDPACGSGHMLTYAFDLLYAIYEEEGYAASDIPALVLTNNLFGLELDERAGALAAFALTMKARDKQRRFFRKSVTPNICVLEDVSFADGELDDYIAEVGRDLFTTDLRETLGQFEQAKNFGSLIVPKLRDVAEVARVIEAKDFEHNLFLREVHERVLKVLRMAEFLSPQYHVVVANPPYMGAGGMNSALKNWAKVNYPNSKSDLYAMFMERALELCMQAGSMAMINMQSWMFLSSYEKLRIALSERSHVSSMAHLGERGFDSIGGSVVSTTAFVLTKTENSKRNGAYLRLVDGKSEHAKSAMAKEAIEAQSAPHFFRSAMVDFEKISGCPWVYWLSQDTLSAFDLPYVVGDLAEPKVGLTTADTERFVRRWFEANYNKIGFGQGNTEQARNSGYRWFPFHKGGEFRRWYGNNEYVVNYENDGAEIKHWLVNNPNDPSTTSYSRYVRSPHSYFLPSLTWSKVSSSAFAVRYAGSGYIISDASNGAFPPDRILPYFNGFLNSCVSQHFLGALSASLNFFSGDIAKIPIHTPSSTVDATVDRIVSISKFDWDAYETSWDFTTLPLLSLDHRGDALEATYTNLRAHWQGMTEEMQRLEEENNRIFIDAYGLQDELTPEVPLEEITLTCNPAYRYGGKNTPEELESKLRADTMREFLSYAVGCMFGRYSLDAPGLILANQGDGMAEYLAKVPAPSFEPDADNVIPVLDGDWFADDITERFRKFLRVTFGEEHFQENLKFIEDQIGDIRKYFTKSFYTDHVKRYKKRPIYWMFSSPKGSFNALIYMHRYRGDTVSVVLNDYLRDYITKLEGHRAEQQKIADNPGFKQGDRTRAQKEVDRVAKVILELREWERDVILPLAQQKIEIDLDDGVKANYPLLGTALKKIAGLG